MESEASNRKTSQKASKFAFVFLGIAVLFIWIQSLFEFIPDVPLKGYFEEVKEPTWTINHWLSGKYQLQTEEVISRDWGLASQSIVNYNQWNFNLFRKSSSPYVVIGKEDVLVERVYLDAYNGWNYVGDFVVEDKIKKLVWLRDTLKATGTELLIIIPPNKMAFYAEAFPKEVLFPHRKTNRLAYTEQFEKHGIHFIDYTVAFKENYSQLQAPLFSDIGTHWSYYGASVANEYLFSKITQINPEFSIKTKIGDVYKGPLEGTETDLADLLNLRYPLHAPYTGKASFQVRAEDPKPSALIIGDSFHWTMVHNGEAKKAYSDHAFWYYFDQEFVYGQPTKFHPKSEVLLPRIQNYDFLILEIADPNLDYFSWGFIDKVYLQKD